MPEKNVVYISIVYADTEDAKPSQFDGTIVVQVFVPVRFDGDNGHYMQKHVYEKHFDFDDGPINGQSFDDIIAAIDKEYGNEIKDANLITILPAYPKWIELLSSTQIRSHFDKSCGKEYNLIHLNGENNSFKSVAKIIVFNDEVFGFLKKILNLKEISDHETIEKNNDEDENEQ